MVPQYIIIEFLDFDFAIVFIIFDFKSFVVKPILQNPYFTPKV